MKPFIGIHNMLGNLWYVYGMFLVIHGYLWYFVPHLFGCSPTTDAGVMHLNCSKYHLVAQIGTRLLCHPQFRGVS